MTPAEWPLPLAGAAFAAAAIVVWLAGWRLARYADEFAERTGIGREFLGMVLLGGATSLPELTVAATATLQGAPVLSINDVLGSAAINVLILALADAAIGRSALTSMLPSPAVMLQGVVGIVLMAVVAGAVLAGDRLVLGVGLSGWLMLLIYFASIRLIARSQAAEAWKPTRGVPAKGLREQVEPPPISRLIGGITLACATILLAGFALARLGESIAEQTGLGASFFGAVFLGLATSLPEASTVFGALRRCRYEMAISDVFGTNLFNVTIIVLVDALHPGGPVLRETGRFAGFAALLALALTAVFLAGMLERRDRTVLRIGVDSAVVLIAYIAGVVVLYGLR